MCLLISETSPSAILLAEFLMRKKNKNVNAFITRRFLEKCRYTAFMTPVSIFTTFSMLMLYFEIYNLPHCCKAYCISNMDSKSTFHSTVPSEKSEFGHNFWLFQEFISFIFVVTSIFKFINAKFILIRIG